MRAIRKFLAFVLLALSPALAVGQVSGAPSVSALLFFQPFCDQCFQVIDNFLVPTTEQQGEALRLEPVDLSVPEGLALYQSTLASFGLSADEGARPTLVVGNEILRGESEILARFPELLEQGLAGGGIALPDLPGLSAYLEGDEMPVPEPEDGLAMGMAWVVFAVLILSLAYVVRQGLVTGILVAFRSPCIVTAWIPMLALIGLGISGYLSFVELGLGEAACGPVGNCSRVQSSPYSKILGVPMAFLGMVYYGSFLSLWAAQRFAPGWPANMAAWLLTPLGIFGVVFSLYLTSLELFVIHAVCVWCLGSALVTALLAVVVTSAAVGKAGPPPNPRVRMH